MGQHSEIQVEERDGQEWNYEEHINEKHRQELDQYSTTAIQLFKGLTKTAIHQIAKQAVNNVRESGNPLEAAESLSCLETFLKEVRADKRFVDYVREEAGKVKEGYVSPSGARIEACETGTQYDYTTCADTVWEQLDAEIKGLTEKKKLREAFLKTIPSSGLIVTDELTGETVKIYPPVKTSTSSFKVTIAK